MSKKVLLKVLTLVLVSVLMVSIFAGCGGAKAPADTETKDTSDTAKSSDTEKKADDTKAAEEKKEPVKLVFWNTTFKTSDDTGRFTKEELAFNKALKEFQEKNAHIKIEVVDQSYDNIPNLFKAAGLAKNGPDMAILWAGSFTNDYKDFILPQDKYYTPEEIEKFQKLTMCRTNFKDDGGLLGTPIESTSLNIFYNKELFKKAGVDENANPATWEEFIQMCQKLKDAGVTPLMLGDKEGWHSTWIICEFLTDLYGPTEIFKYGTGEIKPTDPNFITAMQAWVDFQKLGFTNKDYYTMTSDDSKSKFLAGEAAMRIGGSWDTAEYADGLKENAGTFMIPAISKDAPFADYLCSQFSNNIVVTNYSAHPEEAMQFLKYITSPEFQKLHYEQTGNLPSRVDVDISSDTNNPLAITSFNWIKRNKNVIGFDSIMAPDACQEFYRLAPLTIGMKMTVDEMSKHIQEKFDAGLKK